MFTALGLTYSVVDFQVHSDTASVPFALIHVVTCSPKESVCP